MKGHWNVFVFAVFISAYIAECRNFNLPKLSFLTNIHKRYDSLVQRVRDSAMLRAVNMSSIQMPMSKRSAELLGTSAALAIGFKLADKILWEPSRAYDREANTVGREYDAWTTEGILERYWGEHIHLGYYSNDDIKTGYRKKDFKKAKFDFIDEMMKFGQLTASIKGKDSVKMLDCGCGIGGTSRYLARQFGKDMEVHGITLSEQQVLRAKQLAVEQGIENAQFHVMDALNMSYPDNSFDIVWACESGEHMPDKKRYIEEMVRVLKPGGRLIVATWCQRDETPENPFTPFEKKMLDFLYAEWTHPYFISIADYRKIMEGTGQLDSVATEDWTTNTISSWRHSIWAGVYDPWFVFARPQLWWKCLRDGVTLERMHQAFSKGLMQYGMFTAVKIKQ